MQVTIIIHGIMQVYYYKSLKASSRVNKLKMFIVATTICPSLYLLGIALCMYSALLYVQLPFSYLNPHQRILRICCLGEGVSHLVAVVEVWVGLLGQ